MRAKRWAAALALVFAGPLLATNAVANTDPPPPSEPAPLHTVQEALPGRYIVALKGQFSAQDVIRALPGVEASFTYSGVFSGFAAALTPAQLDAVRSHPAVRLVEEDAQVQGDSVTAKPLSGLAAGGELGSGPHRSAESAAGRTVTTRRRRAWA